MKRHGQCELVDASAPPAKVSRACQPDSGRSEILSPCVSSEYGVSGLRSQFLASGPYRHAVIRPLCDDAFMRGVREELVTYLGAKFKETDIFKVNQTGDFSVIDELPAEKQACLQKIVQLKKILYSAEFRRIISAVTGLSDLSDRVDCAANFYEPGCHLLCHDDGMSTRRVSYIIYLPDPDEEWTALDGGALELYPPMPEFPDMPDVHPSLNVLPLFNSMVFFPVKPGESFHSVQEVYSKTKTRISIQGWFHGPTTVPNIQQGTLGQITSREYMQRLWKPAVCKLPASLYTQLSDAEIDSCTLSSADLAVLQPWILPSYLKPQIMKKMRSHFDGTKVLKLGNFLLPEVGQRIIDAAVAQDETDMLGKHRPPRYEAGLQDGRWKALGPSHVQRLCVLDCDCISMETPSKDVSSLLCHLQRDLLSTEPFARWLYLVTGQRLDARSFVCRRFRPGLDYTVGHFGTLSSIPVVDVNICFVAQAKAWSKGDWGGFECYVAADESGEDALKAGEEYTPNADNSDVLSLEPVPNILTVVLRKPQHMKFVKYVSCAARSSRWDISGEFGIDHQ
jgi:Rps23 Pro-64 3,4-dihydroxylase Tpa1-like proline 4-hydroxylase